MPPPLNVLMILVDQHNARVLGCAGNSIVQTPNIDRLAREGAYFENAFCSTVICSPSRATIATGLWPHTHGIPRNVKSIEDDPARGLAADTILTESVLRERGYTTHWHGKWHAGEITRHPCFNWNPSVENSYTAYPRALAKWNRTHPVTAPPGEDEIDGWPLYMTPSCKKALDVLRGTDKHWESAKTGRKALPFEMEESNWLVRNALADLRRHQDQPFMMTVSLEPPHTPNAIQDPYYSMIDPAKIPLPSNRSPHPYFDEFRIGRRLYELLDEDGLRETLRCYYAQVCMIDDLTGRLLRGLEEMGVLDNTLVIYLSDHGDLQGAHCVSGKCDNYFYDELIRNPLILWRPGIIPPGRRVATFANGVDVMPTLLDYCGAEPPANCQGQSLRRFIEGEEDPERAAFCERTMEPPASFARMIRTRRWKYAISLRQVEGGPAKGYSLSCLPGKGERGGCSSPYGLQWPLELYDLESDPGEERNLSAEPACAPVLAALHDRLLRWMRETADPMLDHVPSRP